MGYAIQGSCAVGVIIWEKELDVDRVHDKSSKGIQSLGIEQYYRDDGTAYNYQQVRVAPGG